MFRGGFATPTQPLKRTHPRMHRALALSRRKKSGAVQATYCVYAALIPPSRHCRIVRSTHNAHGTKITAYRILQTTRPYTCIISSIHIVASSTVSALLSKSSTWASHQVTCPHQMLLHNLSREGRFARPPFLSDGTHNAVQQRPSSHRAWLTADPPAREW